MEKDKDKSRFSGLHQIAGEVNEAQFRTNELEMSKLCSREDTKHRVWVNKLFQERLRSKV